MHIILDTDFGDDIDDTFALYYLLKAFPQSISLVLSAFGQTKKRAELICEFLKKCGRTDIPVGKGQENPAYREPYMYKFLEDSKPYLHYYENGLEKAKEIIESYDDTVIIAIGPVTNLAALADICPKAKDVPVYAMFGSIYRGYFGADSPDKEWNVFADIPASQKMLSLYNNLTVAPLDTCGLIQLEGESYKRFRACENIVAKYYKKWLTLGYHKEEGKSSVQYDTQPIYMLKDNSLLEYKALPLICDEEGYIRVDEKGKTVNCALFWKNKEEFLEQLIKVYI